MDGSHWVRSSLVRAIGLGWTGLDRTASNYLRLWADGVWSY